MRSTDSSTVRKVGRNDLCPCGSGKKFKRCHYGIATPSPAISPAFIARAEGLFAAKEAKERERKERYGEIRPVMSVEAWGKRLVSVHNRLFEIRGKSFCDFLMGYMQHACGTGWWENERAKAAADRHTISRWYDHFIAVQGPPGADGMCSVVPDGILEAYLLLAYDLYVLKDHGKLQKEVVTRLRRQHDFLGARYELLVAATFIRAGFDIEYENERDASRKHPEFIATHKATKFSLAVEAKMRHRPLEGTDSRPKAGMRSLLEDAIEKRGDYPYAVFLEVNLPPDDRESVPSWLDEVDESVKLVVASKTPGEAPFDLVFFTNIPHRYGSTGEPDPPKHFANWIPMKPPSRIPAAIHDVIARAVQQYGHIPEDFPEN